MTHRLNRSAHPPWSKPPRPMEHEIPTLMKSRCPIPDTCFYPALEFWAAGRFSGARGKVMTPFGYFLVCHRSVSCAAVYCRDGGEHGNAK